MIMYIITMPIYNDVENTIFVEVKENSDIIVTIPTNDKLDSLNLAVSTGIILYEINRNRD